MGIKDYIEAFIEITKLGKRILIYGVLALLTTPFLNHFINPHQIYGDFLQKSVELNFYNLSYSSILYQQLIWLLSWIIVIYFFDKIKPETLPLRLWLFIAKFGKALELLELKPWYKHWIFQGGLRIEEYTVGSRKKHQLIIEGSNSGGITQDDFWSLPKRWKNFEMSFDLRFPTDNGRTIGIIFRATDLENYYMAQIRAWNENNTYPLKIIPHIRFRGNWEVMDFAQNNMLENKTFSSDADYLPVKFVVKNAEIKIYINQALIYIWTLPTNVEINHIQHPDPANNQEKKDTKNSNVPRIHFYETFGSIGFRAYPGEKAIVRKLLIRSI